MDFRIEPSSTPQLVEEKNTKVEKISPGFISSTRTFADLPVELKFDIFEYLCSPTDAIAVAQTNRLNRYLIADRAKVWRRYGAHPPLHFPGTLQAAVAEQVRIMPRDVREALSALKAPLNIFSDIDVRNFSGYVYGMHVSMSAAERWSGRKNFDRMVTAISSCAQAAENAGVTMPAVPAAVKSVAAEAIGDLLNKAEEMGALGEVLYMEFLIGRIEEYTDLLRVEMPSLSAEIESFLFDGVQSELLSASRLATRGEVLRMKDHLFCAAAYAKRAGIRLHSLSMEGMTEEVKASYKTFVSMLENDVKPLPRDDQS
jgi:hypothetical protein